MEPITLERRLSKIGLKWVLIGFASSALLGTFFFAVFTLRSGEMRAKTLTQSISRTFRPKILEGNIRDAQAQMAHVIELSTGEYLLIRDHLKGLIYSSDGAEHELKCFKVGSVCWDLRRGRMTYLHPIYFNDDRKDSVFGYIELNTNVYYDSEMAGLFVLVMACLYVVLAFGLQASQRQTLSTVTKAAKSWTETLKSSLVGVPASGESVPFKEFRDLALVVDSMNDEIWKLRRASAEQARIDAQLYLLRGVSHDLKTPFSQLRKLQEAFVSKVMRTGNIDSEMNDRLRRSTERVASLLKQIGDLNRMPLRGVQDEIVDISSEVKSFTDDFQKDFELREISNALFLCRSEEPLFVQIPRVQFYRVIGNLVSNAVDFIDRDSGKIEIEVGAIESRPYLLVRDNGPGIEQDRIGRIFEPDFTSKPSRGTGLGLSIVKSICEEVGAQVSVQSVLGEGSSFKVIFKKPNEPFDVADEAPILRNFL